MQTDETESLPDFVENFDFNDFNLTVDQEEALHDAEPVEWFPMNSPAGKLGIQVNELGEVRSTNPEVYISDGG